MMLRTFPRSLGSRRGPLATSLLVVVPCVWLAGCAATKSIVGDLDAEDSGKGAIELFKDDTRNTPAGSFAAGEPIFGRLTVSTGTLSDIANGDGTMPMSLYLASEPHKTYSVSFPLSDEQKGGSSLDFAIIDNTKAQKTMELVVAWLRERTQGPDKVHMSAGFAQQVKGSFDLDLSPGVSAYDALLAKNEEFIIEENGRTREIAEPGKRDAKLEKAFAAVLAKDLPDYKTFKVRIMDEDWGLTRAPVTEEITHRNIVIDAFMEEKATGKCFIENGMLMAEQHLGKNKYGKPYLEGRVAGTGTIPMPCAKLKSVK